MTLLLLWEEYRAEHGDGYGYSRFCDLYIDWRRGVSATMRQTHLAGEKLFVDYAGRHRAGVRRGDRGGTTGAVFVAVLGASNYTYAEARWSEGLADWIGAHVNALAFLGGAPKLLVCDNLQGGSHRGLSLRARHQPHLPGDGRRTTAPPCCRPGCATARQGQGRGCGADRRSASFWPGCGNRRFLSLGELNEAIRELSERSERTADAQAGRSRREFFETIDRPALLALPTEPYSYAEWRRCRVAPDYHVEVHGHFYSVPSRLIREVVEARITDTTIEIFHAGQRVAAHPRSALKRRHTTTPEHMPSAHRRYAELDAGADAVLCGTDRTRDGRSGRDHHAHQAAPRAGLPGVPGHPAAGQNLWRGTAGSRLPARPDHRRAHLRLDRLDPAHRSRPGLPRRHHA